MRETVSLHDDRICLELDRSTGAIVRLANLDRDLELVDGPPVEPWVLHAPDGSTLTRPTDVRIVEGEGRADVRWSTERGDVITAAITLAAGEGAVRFRVAVTPALGERVDAIDYPVLGGIGALSGDDRLVHSYATGLLFRNPAELFQEGDDAARGVLHAPYPEGFSGSTMQLMAYYAQGRGGFMFATEDPSGAQKWLNFFRAGPGLRAVFGHGTGDLNAPLEPSYDCVVTALTDGTWTEAADRYRDWAVKQPWCARGRLVDRPDRDRRLLEEVGIATFGINACEDRSLWLARIDELAGTPVLHVLGPNWANEMQDYRGNLPGGIDDWFPTRFDEANVEQIRRHHDLLVPFLFDLLFGLSGSEAAEGRAALARIPKPSRSLDAYEFPFLCPTQRFVHRLHAERDARLLGEEAVDGLYYDISANNVIKECREVAHGHPAGGGAFLVEAYRALYSEPARAMRGTELVNEVFVDRIDFYQARAEASPASSFEADRFRPWMKTGDAEKIPLFTYVYHEYGPTRLDGWAKLSREQGELFYWIAARVLVWGGLFELNYEFSPLETVDGKREPLDEHYADLPDHRYEIDEEKAAFVGRLARTRVGPANRYLAYGAMLPQLPIVTPTVGLDWFHYNCPRAWPAFEDSGVHVVDAIVHTAWRADDRAAVVLVNVDRVPHDVTVPLERSELRLDPTRSYRGLIHRDGVEVFELDSVEEATELSLPPREIVVVELLPVG